MPIITALLRSRSEGNTEGFSFFCFQQAVVISWAVHAALAYRDCTRMSTTIRLWDLKDLAYSGQIHCRLHGSDQISPASLRPYCSSGDQLPSLKANEMSLINQHLGISKGWLSRLLLCSEKSRSEWKIGKARQHIEILGEVFHHSLTKIGYSSEGSRSSSWKRVGDLSLPLFRLSSVSELMLHILIYISRSPQQSLIWAMICQTRWSGLLVFKE